MGQPCRPLERRRDVDTERLLAEELRGTPLHRLLDARMENKPGDITLATAHGEFRFKRDEEEALIAVTWIATKCD